MFLSFLVLAGWQIWQSGHAPCYRVSQRKHTWESASKTFLERFASDLVAREGKEIGKTQERGSLCLLESISVLGRVQR